MLLLASTIIKKYMTLSYTREDDRHLVNESQILKIKLNETYFHMIRYLFHRNILYLLKKIVKRSHNLTIILTLLYGCNKRSRLQNKS